MISRKLQPFGTSIFTKMTALALEHGAVNLGQGAPDDDGPAGIIEAAVEALRAGPNQYARSMGVPPLVEAIADHQRRHYGLAVEPMSDITVTCGATEGIASALLGLLNPGDEVIVFEPFYDSYPVCVAMAGGVMRACTLRFPDFAVDFDALEALFNDRTRVLLLNTPHNPTGKVFTTAELERIAALCIAHDVVVVTDEVYEHLWFGDARHVPMATLPDMWPRTLTLSSAGKTYALTGWKIGWAVGPPELVAAIQAAHQFVTFCVPPALQRAVAHALTHYAEDYVAATRADYATRRRLLIDVLTAAGFSVAPPDGTYFLLADFSALSDADDRAFAHALTVDHGVTAIPPSVLYQADPGAGRSLLRFGFCKSADTIRRAGERLAGLAS